MYPRKSMLDYMSEMNRYPMTEGESGDGELIAFLKKLYFLIENGAGKLIESRS